MDLGLATRLGDAVGVVQRISRAIAIGETELSADHVAAEAHRMLRLESPWRAESVAPEVVHQMTGLGPIQIFADDPEVTDILVNGHTDVWVDRGSGLERTDVTFLSNEDVVASVERVIAPLGLRLDRSAPMVEARLPDGSRLHAVLPPASVEVPLVAVRRFTQRIRSLDDLVTSGTADTSQIDSLVDSVRVGENIVVSGGTGAGKTTLLNLLGAVIPEGERVVTIEDAAELHIPGHVVRLEARPANAEGRGEITIRTLLRSALRLRPDRIVVGEVRGAEALDLISALNTGHRGSLTTVHANSPEEALLRLETLALTAGDTSERTVSRQLRSAVDVVVQIERIGTGRRITEIARAPDMRLQPW